jgi:biotin carboxyl carrier protein
MEALLDHGEGLLVPERMIVAPTVGTFRPVELGAGSHVGMLAHPGERIREGQPIAWLRVA